MELACPAAHSPIRTTDEGLTLRCGVMDAEARRTDQIGTGTVQGRRLTERGDQSTVCVFCCGTGQPVIDAVPEGGRASYTACPVWRARREADLAARGEGARMFERPEKPSLDLDLGDGQKIPVRYPDVEETLQRSTLSDVEKLAAKD